MAGAEHMTSCSSSASGDRAALLAVNKTRAGSICSLDTDQTSGLPLRDANCIPRIEDVGNEDIASSLMSYALGNTEFYCDQKTHDTDAPNKQNALCGEKSIWVRDTGHLLAARPCVLMYVLCCVLRLSPCRKLS